MTKLASQIFITNEDFELYMNDHVDDFCYWIDESYLNTTNLQQKMSAMFVKAISSNATHGLEWTELTSLNGSEEMERFLHLKGIIY